MPFSFDCRYGLLLFVMAGSAGFAAEAAQKTTIADARPALLDKAFNAFAEDQGRWAYTESLAVMVDG